MKIFASLILIALLFACKNNTTPQPHAKQQTPEVFDEQASSLDISYSRESDDGETFEIEAFDDAIVLVLSGEPIDESSNI